MTPEERFLAKISPEPNTGCWLWSAGTIPSGYGVFGVNKKLVIATIWAYEHFNEPRNGLFVLHKCDTPACVNPDHLFLGTHRDNMDDMHRKGRENYFGRKGPAKTYRGGRSKMSNKAA